MHNFLDIKYNNLELTVSEFLDLVNTSLNPLSVYITGEISSFNIRGNTVFFTVVDSREEATLECLIWKSIYDSLGVDIEEGMEVKLHGEPSIYKKNGRFRFVANSLIPTGEGALKKAFEKLLSKLKTEGYFDVEKKLELPGYIKRIGLITAEGSDAKKDFETHLGKFGYKVYFYDVRVEGTKAIKEIVEAINHFNQNNYDLDVIVLTRGGGSMESLMAFNSELIAKQIFASKIPIISAVGHENDITIADFVSDVRASTPTDAAKIIAQDWYELESKIKKHKDLLIINQNNLVRRLTTRVQNIYSEGINTFLYLLNHHKTKLETSEDNLMKNFEDSILKTKSKLDFFKQINNSYSPDNVLKQGYSIIRSNNKIVKSIGAVNVNDILSIELFDGNLDTEVKNKHDK